MRPYAQGCNATKQRPQSYTSALPTRFCLPRKGSPGFSFPLETRCSRGATHLARPQRLAHRYLRAALPPPATSGRAALPGPRRLRPAPAGTAAAAPTGIAPAARGRPRPGPRGARSPTPALPAREEPLPAGGAFKAPGPPGAPR